MRLTPIRIAALAACVLLFPLTAYAEAEDGAGVKAMIAKIKAAQKAPDRTGLDGAVAGAADLHNGLKTPALRKQILAALGKVLKDPKGGSARSAAAAELGRVDDAAGAWKQLGKALPKPKAKEVGPSELAALKATAAHAPAGAIAPLMKLMMKSKSYDAAREAITALGRYGNSKKREAILKEMLTVMGRHHAAAEAAKSNPKAAGGKRGWQELGEVLVASLNELTGAKHADADAWLAAWKANKKKLGAIFTSPVP